MKYNNPRILLFIHCKMDAIVKKKIVGLDVITSQKWIYGKLF